MKHFHPSIARIEYLKKVLETDQRHIVGLQNEYDTLYRDFMTPGRTYVNEKLLLKQMLIRKGLVDKAKIALQKTKNELKYLQDQEQKGSFTS